MRHYAIELELDLATVIPHVSGPNDVKTMVSLPEIERKHVQIQKAWLMSCVNARVEDLRDAAEVVRRGRGSPTASSFIWPRRAPKCRRRLSPIGDWQTLVDAGAIPLPPGCGTCIGLGRGQVQSGEVGISATNRNFEGRMGDRDGLVYLGFAGRRRRERARGIYLRAAGISQNAPAGTAVRRAQSKPRADVSVEIIDGFPPSVRGRVLFIDNDNLNTDGIYAGKHTYNDDMTPEQMAAVIFENYDPNFNTLYQERRRGRRRAATSAPARVANRPRRR